MLEQLRPKQEDLEFYADLVESVRNNKLEKGKCWAVLQGLIYRKACAPPHLIIAAWSRVLQTSFESTDFVAWGQAFDMKTIVPNELIGVRNNESIASMQEGTS